MNTAKTSFVYWVLGCAWLEGTQTEASGCWSCMAGCPPTPFWLALLDGGVGKSPCLKLAGLIRLRAEMELLISCFRADKYPRWLTLGSWKHPGVIGLPLRMYRRKGGRAAGPWGTLFPFPWKNLTCSQWKLVWCSQLYYQAKAFCWCWFGPQLCEAGRSKSQEAISSATGGIDALRFPKRMLSFFSFNDLRSKVFC